MPYALSTVSMPTCWRPLLTEYGTSRISPSCPSVSSSSTTSYLLRSRSPWRRRRFFSSSTTGQTPSRHCVTDVSLYERSFLAGFRHFYGAPEDYVILALLPAYLEREGSSLVYMADRLIRESGRPESGYYLYDHDRLYSTLAELRGRGQKTLLLGVAFALLDFTESIDWKVRMTPGSPSWRQGE